ncbi:MAG: alpha/beta hydrolase [Rhodospirillaceae bacterium]
MNPDPHKTGPRLVFVHGWGFEPGVWQSLRAELSDLDTTTIDLGFFGAPVGPASPPDRPLVVVGHSLGVLWLLMTRPFAWSGLISINGFPRFIEGPGYKPAVPRRQLDRMIRRLPADPAGVCEEFRYRCGCAGPLPDGPVPDSLLHGLQWLRDWDARRSPGTTTPEPPILALSGGADPILPVGMDEHCFDSFSDVRSARLEEAGHLLPVTDPVWCAGKMRTFLAEVAPC